MKWVCVFCGSSTGMADNYAAAARELGQKFCRRGLGLVFGGGHIGLMGVLADSVLAGGGQAIGVIPQTLGDKELAHKRLTELRIVSSMHERKAQMADLSDAFIALPGGFGTADEFFEILTWAQLKIHRKPIGLLNTSGFFDPLLTWIDRAIGEGFIHPKYRQLIRLANSPGDLLDILQAGTSIDLPEKVKSIPQP